jgi:hypothetical protein
LGGVDVQLQTRSAVYDVGCDEINGTGAIINYPLDSNLVGAGKPVVAMTPVHLISFKTLVVNNLVKLIWTVDNEVNFKEYEIEWCTDANNFQKIATINAVGSNQASYSYQHNNAFKGNNFYRLKMIDKDGTYTYSYIRTADLSKGLYVNVYPNPAQQYVTIDLNGSLQQQAQIILIDHLGREIKRISSINSNSINISLVGLSPGMYHIEVVQSNHTTINFPIMIVH